MRRGWMHQACRSWVLVLLVAAGCGEVAAPQAADLMEQADAAFARGEEAYDAARSAATFDEGRAQRAAAVAAWHAAGRTYRDAFRLLDPLPVNRTQRALASFRAARAFGKAAEIGVESRKRNWRADVALLWLAQVEQLAPEMRQVWYERAVLFDSDVEGVRNPLRAHAAYTRYLELATGAGALPAAEQARVRRATERAAALAPAAEDR